MSRIEQLISEIEEYIDSCRFQALSNSKIIVNKEELEELLVELRLRIPDEIKKYQKIISQQDAILGEARSQADDMLEDAKRQADSMVAQASEQTSEMINEHEIMQRAYAHANEVVEQAQKAGVRVAALLPRICTDREAPALFQELERLRAMGVTDALAGTLDSARRAAELGFTLRGDYGLGVFNGQTLKELKRLGFRSATLSFELKLAQIRDLSKGLDTELVVYGRLPLMITENCIIHNHSGRHTCANVNLLTDRKGERFPVVKAPGCRNEILNSKKLFLADKAGDWQRLGLWAGRLMFTTENARECVQVLERYLGRGSYQPNDYTRGLYYRGVE